MNKDTIKRHLISFLVTFGATFILVLVPALNQDSMTTAVLLSVIIAAARSAFKIAYEMAILPLLTLIINWAKGLVK